MHIAFETPEWRRREIAVRAAIGFAAGAVAVVTTSPDRPLIDLFGDQRFLADRILYSIAGSIVALAVLRRWYGGVTAGITAGALLAVWGSLWANQVPFSALRAVLKPVAPALWSSLFGNPDNTIAYAPLYGLAVGILLIVAIPAGRMLVGGCIAGSWCWAARMRAEDGLFGDYRELFRLTEAERNLPAGSERERTHEEVLQGLASLDRWTTRNTGVLIDLLRRSYGLRSSPTASQAERLAVAQQLDREMIRVWVSRQDATSKARAAIQPLQRPM